MNPSPATETEAQTIARLLATCRTVAVVGLSPKPARASHEVARVMQAAGWRIVPVNPVAAGQTILGEAVFATLHEAAQHARIDLVNVFRTAEDVPPVVDEAIAIGAPALWLQLGIRHDEAAARARAAGMSVVQDKCLKVEWARRSPPRR
ncbi:MAG: CoA-binding protein [Tibeticola sp.]